MTWCCSRPFLFLFLLKSLFYNFALKLGSFFKVDSSFQAWLTPTRDPFSHPQHIGEDNDDPTVSSSHNNSWMYSSSSSSSCIIIQWVLGLKGETSELKAPRWMEVLYGTLLSTMYDDMVFFQVCLHPFDLCLHVQSAGYVFPSLRGNCWSFRNGAGYN